MCHSSYKNITLEAAVESAAGTVLPINHRRQSKMTFRPFRKVAKSARINLNKYWGLLSQSSLSTSMTSVTKHIPIPTSTPILASEELDFSHEMQQNRINELLEAQAVAAIKDNARNNQFESSPDFHARRLTPFCHCHRHPHHHFRQNSVQSFDSSSSITSSSSSWMTSMVFDNNCHCHYNSRDSSLL